MAKEIVLGFVDLDQSGGSLHPDKITSADDLPHKVGGRPVWLHRNSPLDVSSVTCSKCQSIMPLLVQLYTPDDEVPEAFFRIVYLFACKNGTCKSFKVFRSQLPESNSHWTESSVLSPSSPTCQICGLKGSKVCTGCKAIHYCSKEHQAIGWKKGKHNVTCGTDCQTVIGDAELQDIQKLVEFKEWEIVTEVEPESGNAIKDIEAQMKGAGITETEEEAAEAEDEIRDAPDTTVDVDNAFLMFQNRMDREPEQIIRWARCVDGDDSEIAMDLDEEYEETEKQVLWVADIEKPDLEKDIGNCQFCQRPRVFEFQVMPTLLNHLAIDHASDKAFDFGTVVVYSCPDRCQPTSEGSPLPYMEEIAFHQNFSTMGLNDRIRNVLLGGSASGVPPSSE
ncbi:UNVERIFIED_CONTAM: Programmed cell death protein 2 [Siphonaria sp. JEL0065]|nr:Programmed cell death protein 2 [Siphonaria sp. JEL0065]